MNRVGIEPRFQLPNILGISIVFLCTATSFALAADCNGNGVEDFRDLSTGSSDDCNENGIPDECEQTIFNLGRTGVTIGLAGPREFSDAADFDGDGDLDLAVSTGGDSSPNDSGFKLYLNEDGEDVDEFSASEFVSVGSRVVAFLAADLGGKDSPDLPDLPDVVVQTTESVQIFWNEGQGIFSPPLTIARPRTFNVTNQLAAADLDGDGERDLVVKNRSGNQLSIYRNNGDRTLAAPVTLEAGRSPRAVAMGNLDGDGNEDIVTVNGVNNTITILFNESSVGTLAFSPAVSLTYESSSFPVSLVVEDLNNDGIDDAAVGSIDEGVLTFINRGDGRDFELGIFSSESLVPNILAAADFDRDGDLDLVSNTLPEEPVPVLINDGSGVFRSRVDFGGGNFIASFEVGDFDDDHDQDVCLVTSSSAGVLTFLWNGQEVNFELRSHTFPMLAGRRPHSTALVDLDGDNHLDFATCDGSQTTLSILLNDQSGNLVPLSYQSTGEEFANSLAADDFDQDGDIDVAIVGTESTEVRVLYNDGNARFPDQRNFTFEGRAFFITSADLNEDGYPDLITANFRARSVSIILNDGTGSGDFVASPEGPIGAGGGAHSVTSGDFDRDGDIDLAVANHFADTVAVLLNRGDATFEPRISIRAGGGPFGIVAGDWDNDGDLDLATSNKSDESVSIFHNSGSGSFELIVVIPIGQDCHSLKAGDLTGDGYVDLVTTNEGRSSSSVLFNDRNGTFFHFSRYKTGDGPRFAEVGDLDLDGDIDIVSANRNDATITILYNEPPTPFDEDFTEQFCTIEDFGNFSTQTFSGNRSVKYVLPSRNDPDLFPAVFQNSTKYLLHEQFMQLFVPGFSRDALVPLTQLRDTRAYFIGAVERLLTDSGFIFVYSIVTGPSREEVLELDEVRWVDALLRQAITVGPVYYAPDLDGQSPLAREAAESWGDNPGFDIYFGTVETDLDLIAYTTGVGYGRLRLLTRAEFDDSNGRGLFTFQDVVVTDHAPRDMEGVVGGFVTADPQGALSHLPVRTARRGTPNVFVEGAMSIFAPFEDKLVRLEVTETEYTITEATLEEAEEFWSMRPSLPPLPPVDDSYANLDRFEDMDFSGPTELETRFGGKATGLGRLQTVLTGPWEEYRESGFAIPMYYYFEFMSINRIPSMLNGDMITYEEYLTEIFNLPRFQTDSAFRFVELASFRAFARSFGRLPDGLEAMLIDRIEEVFGTRGMAVRFRSSSNVEDRLQFNGAGLYESTSVCVLDTLDDNADGPSLCDPNKENERAIDRALKKVWTSLWTYRAHEERAFFQIPQDPVSRDVGMGILVNRAFLDEAANGVAFTGDPSNPREGCYLITSQAGEESVVSPTPGVLAERDIAVAVDGEVLDVVRDRSSTEVPAGTFVLSVEKIEELGRLMHHIDQNYPLDTEGLPRERVLLDFEFKLEQDGSLAVKQVRPFLIGERENEWPTFELEIPEGTTVCASLDLSASSNNPRGSYESKSLVKLRAGTLELPTRACAFSLDLIDEALVGPERELAIPQGPGIVQVEDRVVSGTNTAYEFRYTQNFSLQGADGETRSFELGIFNLAFESAGADPVNKTLVFDEEYLTFDVSMLGFANNPDLSMTYRSCLNEELPTWLVEYQLEDGGVVRLKERFLPPPDFNTTGPASLESASVELGGSRQVIRSYWDLVYAANRHNTGVTYWVLLDPPISVPGVDELVHGLELKAEDPPEVFEIVDTPQQAAAAYLDENLEVLARPGVSLYLKRTVVEGEITEFRRGDANDDGSLDTSDVLSVLEFLFVTGPTIGCPKAADVNDDGRVNLSDAVSTALHLFRGKAIPPPFGACGLDPTLDELECDRFGECF